MRPCFIDPCVGELASLTALVFWGERRTRRHELPRYETIRHDLEQALRMLVQRHAGLERDAAHETLPLERVVNATSGCRRALGAQLDRIDHDEARIRSAIRRIERREFDRCILCGGRIPVTDLRFAPFTAACSRCRRGRPVDYAMEMRLQHASLRALIRTLRLAIRGLVADGASEGEDAPSRSVAAAEPPAVPRARRGPTGCVDPEEAAAARVLLLDLERELAAHHAVEERHESLRSAIHAAPRLARSVDALRREHATLADALHEVVERSRSAGAAPDAWRDVAQRFEAAADSIRAHEEQENELAIAAFLDDLGTAD